MSEKEVKETESLGRLFINACAVAVQAKVLIQAQDIIFHQSIGKSKTSLMIEMSNDERSRSHEVYICWLNIICKAFQMCGDNNLDV